MRKKYGYFYKRHNLKQVTGFVSEETLTKLKRKAKAEDKSLARYVTRLLEKDAEAELPDSNPDSAGDDSR